MLSFTAFHPAANTAHNAFCLLCLFDVGQERWWKKRKEFVNLVMLLAAGGETVKGQALAAEG